MRKDPTEFRERFAKWKAGEKVYEAGLPKYGGGKGDIDFHDDVTKHIIRKEGVLTAPTDIGDGKISVGSGLTQQKYIDQCKRNGNKWSQKENYIAVKDTVRGFENSLRGILPEYDQYPAEMRKALIDIIYNIGEGGLKNSPKFLSAMKSHNWNEAKRLMDWDNSDPLFGNGARKRNAERAALFDAGLAHWSPAGPVELMMENKPVFVPQPVFVPLTKNNTDYSIETMTSPTIPLMLNSRNSGDSPLYGGSDYSFRLPSIKEVVKRQLFLGLPKYGGGKVVLNNHTNAKFNDDGTFTDDTTRVFDDIIITPNGLTTKYGSYTDKNWDRYKLLESFYRRYDLLTGKLKFEPGLEITSPEYDVLSIVRGILGALPKKATTITAKNATKITPELWDNAYMSAVSNNNIKEAQRLRDLHFKVKSPGNKVVDTNGNPIKQYHTVSDEHDPNFNIFNPTIEGLHSNIYTSNDPFMSATYSSKLVSEAERDYIIDVTRKMRLNSLQQYTNPDEYVKSQIKIYSNPKKAKTKILNDHPWLKGKIYLNQLKLLYSYLRNPVVVDNSGKDWAHLSLSNLPEDVYKNIKIDVRGGLGDWYSTRSLEKAIDNLDYDGAIVKNVADFGGRKSYFNPGVLNGYGSVYSIKKPNYLKYADAITYDDAGKIIPLSQRDNFNIADLRYGIVPTLIGGYTYLTYK